MLQLQDCAAEECSGILFTDTTGVQSEDNPGGYSEENNVTSPLDFTSYEVSFWSDGMDPQEDPLVTIDLTGNIPEPDDEGHYSWQFTLEQLGLTTIQSGVWLVRLVGVIGLSTYTAEFRPIFTQELESAIRAKMPSIDPSAKCGAGCDRFETLASLLDSIRCYGPCSGGTTSKIIKYIRTQLRNCC